jgi:CHAT domain-containing protein
VLKKFSINFVVKVRFATCLLALTTMTGILVCIDVSSLGEQKPSIPSEQSLALEEAKRLSEKVVRLYQEGKYNDAIPLAKNALAIREKVLGNKHLDVAQSLNDLGALYWVTGYYKEAEILYQRSLIIRENLLGNEHPYVAQSLNNLATLYWAQGYYKYAESLLKRAIKIREKVQGKEHPDVAMTLNNLGEVYRAQGYYKDAEYLYKRALRIIEKVRGKEHPDVTQSLNNLAELYRAQGYYKDAEYLYKRALTITEKALGKEHPYVGTILNNLAELYRSMGNYKDAENLYQRALKVTENTLGKEHPDVAQSLNNLAALYQDMGNYQDAKKMYQVSLAIREKVLGKQHPNFAQSLNNLATLYWAQGYYKDAEFIYQRSLKIIEKALGKEHPDVAKSLNNLAALYRSMGSYKDAESLVKRSLAIREKALGKEHPDVAQSLNNLAELYRDIGNYEDAEPLYQSSLAIRKKALGKEHPDVAQSLNNLAELYRDIGNYEDAEPLYQSSLAIREKALGKEHPDVAQSLNNLAELYRNIGNYKDAETLYQRSVEIYEKALNKQHPHVATTLINLALLYQTQGNINRVTDLLSHGLAIQEKNLQLIYVVGSEQRKQNYLRTFTGTTDATISLAFQQDVNSPNTANLAITTTLRRKGRVLDAVADSIKILRSRLERQPETKKLFDEWLSIQQQLSAQVFQELGKQTPEQYKARIEQLETERQSLEAAISEKSAEFRQEIQPVELAAIQARIPKDAALVEIVQYQPFNPKAKKHSEAWGQPRYAAAVIHSQGEPKWVDLGDAATIDESVRNLQAGLRKPQFLPQIQQAARKLDEQLMKPIRPWLGNVNHILLSPDGQLTLLPFDALVDEQGQYLIQRYAFSYLTAGRDLLRFESPTTSRSSPVVLADIDYGQAQTGAATSKAVSRYENFRSADLTNLVFGYLSKTKDEAEAIRGFLPNIKVLLGKDATETAVKKLQAPSILHLATHGFFLSDQEINLSPSLGGSITQPNPKVLQLENPLLRSGLALANINNRNKLPTGSDDGVLTAFEVAGLNLRGTQLVVMSACDTGKGDIKVGEGVYGLRRALVIAGSQSQVLSLWKVSDEATKELMVKYYSKLHGGRGRHEALREAQLEMLNSQDYKHPFFWAAFVPSGDWSALNNK